MISPPAFASDIEAHADWLEVTAILRGFYSWTDYQRDLRIGLSVQEADDELATDEEPFERLADDISRELLARSAACVRPGCYPFQLEQHGLTSLSGGLPYRFMLILSLLGHRAGPDGVSGAQLFEDLSAWALRSYLGYPKQPTSSFVFGFPRRVGPRSFTGAVDHLCTLIGEGHSHRSRDQAPTMKDAGLDVVAWHSFPDDRDGKLILFGQCSTGGDWTEKLMQLDPEKWCQLWMDDMPTVKPVAAFLAPFRIPETRWAEANIKGGIVFDRCRLTWLTSELPFELRDQLASWCDYALRKTLGGRFAA